MGGDDERCEGPPCASCKGTGWVVLLITRKPCSDCDGTGINPDGFDDEWDEEEEDTPARGAGSSGP